MNSPQLRASLLLAAVALAALAASLLLAFASARAPRSDAYGDVARRTTAEAPIAAPAAQPPAVSATAGADAEHDNDVARVARDGPSRPLLRALLAPWAFVVDAIAVLGLAAVFIVQYNARRRRGART